MKILFAASECAPFIKSGGLGDVAQALPQALAKVKNTEVSVFLPYYAKIKNDPSIKVQFLTSINVKLGWRECYAGIFKLKSAKRKLNYYFIDNEYYFMRDGLYGYFDDGERFAFFSKAVLEASLELKLEPNVFHANDWQTAMIPVLISADAKRYGHPKTLFTIHNIEYQGWADTDFPEKVLGLTPEYFNIFEFGGRANFLKAAIITSHRVNTVSRSYADELKNQYFAHGLDGILRDNSHKFTGIVNGIDTDLYNPAKDPEIQCNFSSSNPGGKLECKRALQKELGLDIRDDVPIIAMISRLVSHKGLELIECVLKEITDMDIQLVILGTGDARFEGMFRAAAGIYPNKISASIKFNSALASRIYAGSDFLLMPSKSEPCGLSQLIAMRYGTLPIVREIGGLKDTVPAINPLEATGRGITFKSYNAHDMLDAIRRAVELYHNKELLDKIKTADMRFDSGWSSSVNEYIRLYNS